MARQVRIEYEGALYHVMARGNRRDPIFVDNEGGDEKLFLDTLEEACRRSGFEVWAWVLMKNHYHLVIETPQGNLVEGMKWLQNTYTRRFNVKHKQWGRLFGDRYKAVVIEDDRDLGVSGEGGYLSTVIDYVHLNPARAGLIDDERGQSLLEYRWSSLSSGYGVSPSKRAKWLKVGSGLNLFGFSDRARDRRQFVKWLDERMVAEKGDDCGLSEIEGQTLQSTLRRGWYWGKQGFREALLDRLEKKQARAQSRNYSSGAQGKDHSYRMAESLIGEGVLYFALADRSRETFMKLGRGASERAAIAWVLCRKTTVPQKWIAQRLGISSAANVSQQARRFELASKRKLESKLREWRKFHGD